MPSFFPSSLPSFAFPRWKFFEGYRSLHTSGSSSPVFHVEVVEMSSAFVHGNPPPPPRVLLRLSATYLQWSTSGCGSHKCEDPTQGHLSCLEMALTGLYCAVVGPLCPRGALMMQGGGQIHLIELW